MARFRYGNNCKQSSKIIRYRPPEPMKRPYWRRRILRHLLLGVGSAGLAGGVFWSQSSRDVVFRLSLASAYVGLVLLGASLVIGPWRVLRGRANPVNSDLRRDIGIWAGIVGLAHVVIGLQVHLKGRMSLYFLF